MRQQVLNPCLPENEYIPDVEPYIFGNRVYLYGSHDRFGAPMFCMNDYVCWSAPLDDLGNWKYEGVIYRKNQDPKNRLGLRLLFAPDVVRGTDGRYYLYYAFDFMEAAFGNSQEMVIFITELNANYFSMKFINEHGCDRYYMYNKGLLFQERQKEVLEEIQELTQLTRKDFD